LWKAEREKRAHETTGRLVDWLSFLFLGAFAFGLLFCALSVLFGATDLGFDGDGQDLTASDAAEPGLGNGGVDASRGVSPWNLTGLTAFIAWFGGVGYLASALWQLTAWASLMLATFAGLIGWALIYAFLTRVLLRREARMDPADYRMEGTVARVTVPISAGRIGEIQYTRAGARRSEGARSSDGSAIARDTEVVIVGYDGGIAYVEPWREFVEKSPAGR